MSRKVYLGPSSQMHNAGVVKGYIEALAMDKIAAFAATHLRAQNTKDDIKYIVKVSPVEYNNGDQYEKKVTASNAFGADVHVAIHSNAGNGQMRGTNTYYNPNMPGAFRLATDINRCVSDVSGKNDGVHIQTGWAELNVNCPSCLVEVAFHDNKKDCELIVANYEAFGMAICNAIRQFLEGR